MNIRHLLLVAVLLIAACDSADPIDPGPVEPVTTGILVASQGAFGVDDGGVALFRLDGTVASRQDGLYVQSIAVDGDYVFVTSTNRIARFTLPDLEPAGQVANVPNPRFISFAGDHGYATNLYTDFETFGDGAVTRFSTSSLEAEEPVLIGGNPEGIARVGDRLFVASHNWGEGNHLTVLDAGSMQVIDSIDLGCDGPQTVFADVKQDIQVICEGLPSWHETPSPGAFVTVDPDELTVVARTDLDVSVGSAVGGPAAGFDPQSRYIHAISGDLARVHQFDTTTNSLIATIDVGGAPLGGVAFDARREYLYLARVHPSEPFTAQGTLTVHSLNGTLLDTFSGAGVAPAHVLVLVGEEE